MKGAIIGDIIGSAYEFSNISTKDFPLFSGQSRFTDDTVMTCAVAKVMTDCRKNGEEITAEKIVSVMQGVGRGYPDAGYGARFINWMFSDDPQPYNSCGNGSAMRISAVGFLAESEEEVKVLSEKISAVSHNHPEGIKGAECTAMCIYMARKGFDKDEIKARVESDYYVLDRTCDEYRREMNGMHGKELCRISVPQALECFFESTGFEDCIRNCISIGGDSDTIAAIAGGIAEAYYGVQDNIWKEAEEFLDDELKEIVREMYEYKPLTVSYEQFEALVKKDFEKDLPNSAPEQRDRYFYGSEAQSYLRQEYDSYYRKYHGFDIGKRQFRNYAVSTVSFCLTMMYE